MRFGLRKISLFAVWCCAVLLLSSRAFVVRAQLAAPEEKPIIGARMPALSPDGKRLAFVWRGDIWVASATGGRGYSVTEHVELDAYPIFSPDGRWLAFSSMRNNNWDIFVVPSQGGAVRQMTFSSGSEIATDWSPDGKTILFAGSRDVPDPTLFALDVASLRFRKLTSDYKALGGAVYSSDAKRVAFQRHGFPWMRPRYTGSAAAQLWTLDLQSNKRTSLVSDERQHLWPRFLPDGKTIVCVTVGENTPNAQSLNKPLPRLQDNALRTPNLWAFAADGSNNSKPRQLTSFVGGSVRAPAVARQSGDIAFEHERDLYLLSAGNDADDKPRRLVLYAGAEDKQNNISREVLTAGVQEAEISPDGKTFAFLVRGDIWTIPVEKAKTRNADDATRLTDHPGFDRDFNWSKDGKSLFFVSDRDGNDRIYAVDVATQAVRPVWTGSQDARAPKVSPDGTLLGFWVAGPANENGSGGLYVVPIAAKPKTPAPAATATAGPPAANPAAPVTPATPTPNTPPGQPAPVNIADDESLSEDTEEADAQQPGVPGRRRRRDPSAAATPAADAATPAATTPAMPLVIGTPRRVVAVPGAVQGEFSWSPDMKWLAYTRRGVESDGYNIWIMPAGALSQTGIFEPSSTPAINVTRLNARHWQPTWSPDGKYLFFASNRDGDGLYVLPLQPEEARGDDIELTWEKPKAPLDINIDFVDTAQRIRKLNAQPISSDLSITNEGQLFWLSAGSIWTASYDGEEPRQLAIEAPPAAPASETPAATPIRRRRFTPPGTPPVGTPAGAMASPISGAVSGLRVGDDGRTVFFSRDGGLFSMRVAPPAPPKPVTFSARWERDLRAEQRAAFNQFWRTYNTRFYDGNFHGRDWAAIRNRYEPLLDGVGTKSEFATLLNMMVGELETSHAEVGAAPLSVTGPSTRHLGVYFDYSYAGPGLRVREVPSRAPGSYARTRIKAGEYIVSIDGKDVTLDENLYKVLNDKGDKDFELLVNDKPGKEGARKVRFKALTSGEWDDIHYRNGIERSRRLVEQKSGGKMAYVHIQGMGAANQIAFERELYEYAEGKEGVIIDVRFNGGGNIASTLINWLGTKPFGTSFPRDGYPDPTPDRAWNKPIVVLMNEHSASNAESFPYGMRQTGLAKLVGMPTPGYVIGTTDLPLVDGTRARMPFVGRYRADGTPLENRGEQPDVRVDLTAEDWLADRDPQLERAIELLRGN